MLVIKHIGEAHAPYAFASTGMSSSPQFIDTETFTMTNSKWVNLTKAELLELPWIVEALSNPGSLLFFNSCLGFVVDHMTDAGAIHYKSTWSENPAPLYIAKNTSRPARLLVKETTRDDEGYVASEPLNAFYVRRATVSYERGTLSDGFRVAIEGPNVYRYDKNGVLC